MASFGHLAVGMLTGQLHGAAAVDQPKRRRYAAIALFAAFAVLPDADLILVACGAHDWGAIGHRGASHSLITALLIGTACGLLARRLKLPPVRTALAVAIAVGSHGLLDTVGENGRGIPLLWPLTDHRFLSPWRVLPDAPRVEDFFCRQGVASLMLEFCYFLPLMAYVLWPRRKAAASAVAAVAPPALRIVNGGRAPAVPAAGKAASTPEEPEAPDIPDDQVPPLRSSG